MRPNLPPRPRRPNRRCNRISLIEGIAQLDSTLQGINDLPREKSEKFAKKMSLWLNLSLLPLGNLAALFPVGAMIKEYLPALTSSNTSYVALKRAHVGKLQTYSYVHLAPALTSGIVALLVEPPARIVLLALALTYVISAVLLYLKGGQLKKL